MSAAGHKGCQTQDRFPFEGLLPFSAGRISKSFLVFGAIFFSTRLDRRPSKARHVNSKQRY